MAETNAPPTKAQVLNIRPDLRDFLPEGRTIDSYITLSLAEAKRILEDERGTKWTQVFDTTDDAYLDNDDSTGRNQDRIQNAMCHQTAAFIFRDYSIKYTEDDQWAMLADYHEEIARKRLVDSLLDIDLDESGAVDDDEEMRTGQVFFIK